MPLVNFDPLADLNEYNQIVCMDNKHLIKAMKKQKVEASKAKVHKDNQSKIENENSRERISSKRILPKDKIEIANLATKVSYQTPVKENITK